MNKEEVMAEVSRTSGVDGETCEKVVGALKSVLQRELAKKGGTLAKITAVLEYLKS